MNNQNSDKKAERMPARSKEMAIVSLLTCLAMVGFAANSLLTRAAFRMTSIDAASFTAIRVVSGALMLLVILRLQGATVGRSRVGLLSAAFLFTYAAAFSFAYRDISAGAGALVLFAAAQLVMISYGFYKGERTSVFGLLMALCGMAAFLVPSASAPPLWSALLMALAGFAWGAFSLLGRSGESPIAGTASSFLWAVPLSIALMLVQHERLRVDQMGAIYALLSGSLASALGYAIWYWVRVRMTTISAGAVQLSVPVISAVLGVLILAEEVTLRSAISALVTLGGVTLVTLTTNRRKA